MELRRFRELIQTRTGLFFEGNYPADLEREIRRAMSRKGIASSARYFELISRNSAEFLALVAALTIKETYFFREPAYIRIFAERLIPEFMRTKPPGARIRILSAGCSTGEEPYSLAITLLERYGPGIGDHVTIIGADIDGQAIEKARKGIYSDRAFRGAAPHLRDRYFRQVGPYAYQLRKAVREMVAFHPLNLLSTPYPEVVRQSDIIFYRNVSIYFEPAVRLTIFRKLTLALNANGYIIVSSSETLSHDYDILSLTEIDGIFLYRKAPFPSGNQAETAPPRHMAARSTQKTTRQPPVPVGSHGAFQAIPRLRAARQIPPVQPSRKRSVSVRPDMSEPDKGPEQRLGEALALARNKAYDKARKILDGLMAAWPSFVRAHTLKAGILLNLGQTEAAKQLCCQAVTADALCLEGYLLLGLIAREQKRPDEARRRFREALYIAPSNWLAHFYLGESCRDNGAYERACRAYGRAMTLLEEGRFSDHGLSFFPISFSEDQVLYLCRHHTKQLSVRLRRQE